MKFLEEIHQESLSLDHKNLEPDDENAKRSSCPVEAALKVIGGRWKVLILRELFGGIKRFGQLHRALHGITQKMLTQQLRELERDGLVDRHVYMQVPPKVEYSLTPLGKTLEPVLNSLHDWSTKYLTRS
ncbi:helix-turn-helix domain-containing protein [Tumidithrix elongata RA019]|uniref:Helix-turn-helix domain-containing protein n=1 Tax=Tumidithrix elongata BACA0141 TaxID=2716417 RepID=A0AAW9Q2V1_9CYAN|nr:helix-turn-helix domain-containing protein [Tumidithrix elongata RA019]